MIRFLISVSNDCLSLLEISLELSVSEVDVAVCVSALDDLNPCKIRLFERMQTTDFKREGSVLSPIMDCESRLWPRPTL